MTDIANPEIKFQVCHRQLLQHISRFIIRVWNATDKHSQTLPDYWFKRVSLHHQCYKFYSAGYSTMKKIFGADIKNMIVWSIVLYQDFFKVIPKTKLGSHFNANIRWSKIFRVTDQTLNAASVAPHQLKNGTAPIMTWWLSLVIQCGHRLKCAASPGV